MTVICFGSECAVDCVERDIMLFTIMWTYVQFCDVIVAVICFDANHPPYATSAQGLPAEELYVLLNEKRVCTRTNTTRYNLPSWHGTCCDRGEKG